MAFLEPTAIPGLDKALEEMFVIFSIIVASGFVLTISSIVGVIRAVRRRRRGGYSVAAVVFSASATVMTTCWLLYWVGDNIHHGSNPLDGLLAINLLVCMPPLSWLITAIRANANRRS
jgi:hypothetical protein